MLDLRSKISFSGPVPNNNCLLLINKIPNILNFIFERCSKTHDLFTSTFQVSIKVLYLYLLIELISVVEKETHPETKRLKFTKVLPKKIDKSDPVSYVFSKKDSVLSDDEFRYKRILKWLINVEFDRECEKLHSKSTH